MQGSNDSGILHSGKINNTALQKHIRRMAKEIKEEKAQENLNQDMDIQE